MVGGEEDDACMHAHADQSPSMKLSRALERDPYVVLLGLDGHGHAASLIIRTGGGGDGPEEDEARRGRPKPRPLVHAYCL
jgi:hypothetical protein